MDVAAPFIGVWAVWSIAGWCAVSMRSGILRKGVVLAMVVTACSLVFWLWEHSAWLRGLAVIPVLLLLGKSWMIGVRRIPWLDEPVKPVPFALWCLVLPEGRRSADPMVRASIRQRAAREALRALAKGLVLALLLALNDRADLATMRPIQLVWTAVVFYLCFSMLRDVLGVVWGMLGVEVCDVFDSPLIARNPREFWGARWNLWFTRTVHRLVFEPMRSRYSAVVASAVVFALSALIHEAIVVVGLAEFDGRMILFFAIQGMGTVLYSTLKARGYAPWPRPLAVATHFCWMWLTVAWFLDPLDAFTGVSTWGLDEMQQFVGLD